MKIDFSKTIQNIEGTEIRKDNASEELVTLQFVCREALLSTFPEEKNLSGEKKFKRWELAGKLLHGETDIPVESITEIKELVGKMYGPGIVGPVYQMLEGK